MTGGESQTGPERGGNLMEHTTQSEAPVTPIKAQKIFSFVKKITLNAWFGFNRFCELLQPLGELLIRFWIAKVFFLSGLVKIQSWATTLMLFQYEYHVPLLSPNIAAPLSAGIELIVSPLLLLGLGGRIPALILFVFNFMAATSYPFLWTDAGYVGLKDHICWGMLLLILVLYGPGKMSLDHLINVIVDYRRKKKSFLK